MNNDLLTIEQEWQKLCGYIFRGVRPSDVQYKETRQAFYAGAFAILQGNTRIGEPDVPVEVGVAWLDGRLSEAKAFFRQVAEGVEPN